MSSEKKAPASGVRLSRHLILNTFGPATLEYRGRTVANSKTPSHEPCATADFMFRIFVNPDESIDIQRNPHDPEYRLQIVNHGHRAATLIIRENEVEVDANYTSDMFSVVQRPLRKVAIDRRKEEESKMDTLALIIDDNQPLRRIDYRYRLGLWVSIFVHETYVISVRPNGDYFAMAATSLMWETGRKYLRHCNEHGNAPIDFGLVPLPTRLNGMPSNRVPARPQSTPISTPTARMPVSPLANTLPNPLQEWIPTGTVSSATGARSKEKTAASQSRKASSSENSDTDDNESKMSVAEETLYLLKTLTEQLRLGRKEAKDTKKKKQRE